MNNAWWIVVSAILLILVVTVVALCLYVSTLSKDLANLRRSHSQHCLDVYGWVKRTNQTLNEYGRTIDEATGGPAKRKG